jgi:hypothetical protein
MLSGCFIERLINMPVKLLMIPTFFKLNLQNRFYCLLLLIIHKTGFACQFLLNLI